MAAMASSSSLISGVLSTPAAVALPSSIQGLLSGSRRFAGLVGKRAELCRIVWRSEAGRKLQSPLFVSRIGGARSSISETITTFDVGSKGLVEDYEELLQDKAEKIREHLNGTCIFLIGMMGSGKTTVGRVLSKCLGYYFFDSDELVEQAAGGSTVAQIFEESDEEGFRKAETEVLRQLSALGRLVVATGGGAVVEPHNWGYLRHGIVVWLNVPLDALAKRVTAVGTESRPLLPPDAAQHQAFAHLSQLLEQRGAAYAHADATVSVQVLAEELGVVDSSEITPTMIALQVLEEIDKLLIEKKRKMPKLDY